jgi:6-phosphogluconolactonase
MTNPLHFSPSELQSQRKMAEPNVQVFKDLHELSKFAAQSFADIAKQSIRQRSRFTVSLSGGNTPMKMYEILGDQFQSSTEWDRVHFFWGDERCVPADDPGNCYGQAKRAFLNEVRAPLENIHRVESELEPVEAALRYALTLEQYADPPLAWPRFDLVLLGMGDDGHTASLFPGSPVEVTLAALPVVANYQDRPARRVTLTQNVFNDARNIYFLAVGKSKAETLRNVLKGEHRPDLYPAQRIKPNDGKITWLVDEGAASLL